jgi:DNA-binding Lrp family transcriptional regulator
VHDTADLEARGLPTVFVATVEFEDGAQRQAEALGADVASVLVSHPIQDRTDDEMREIADKAVQPLVAALVDS